MARQTRLPVIDAPDDLKSRFAKSEQRLRELNSLRTRLWLYDPVRWVEDCINFGPGEGLTSYQKDSMRSLVEHRKHAVRGPHGLGKSTTAALAVLWFALTRDLAAIDWKCPTTAGAWRQLQFYLWPEIHKWAKQINWNALGRGSFSSAELLDLSLKLTHGEAFAVAASDPMLIEGAHADSMLYLYDEAKSIDPRIFDASEGAFSGARDKTGELPEAFGLALSTPGDPEGRFWEIHTRKPGFEDWSIRHVTLEDAIKARRISAAWAERRRRQWGEKSQLYANRVLGEFKGSEGNSIIPLQWVEAAIQRWHSYREDGVTPGELTELGVDVAREGDDETVLAFKAQMIVTRLRTEHWDDTTVTAGWVNEALSTHPQAHANIDVIGIGAGVFDMVREVHGRRVHPFQAAESTDRPDRTGEHQFVNKRAAAWWHLRDLLDPAYGPLLALPDDELLVGDLTTPRWKMTRTGKIQLEAKDEVKRRIGRSPDRGDAVVMVCWPAERRARMTFAGREPYAGRVVGSAH